jgi:hypothetical protein
MRTQAAHEVIHHFRRRAGDFDARVGRIGPGSPKINFDHPKIAAVKKDFVQYSRQC